MLMIKLLEVWKDQFQRCFRLILISVSISFYFLIFFWFFKSYSLVPENVHTSFIFFRRHYFFLRTSHPFTSGLVLSGKNLSLAMSCTLTRKMNVHTVEALISDHHGNLKKWL